MFNHCAIVFHLIQQMWAIQCEVDYDLKNADNDTDQVGKS